MDTTLTAPTVESDQAAAICQRLLGYAESHPHLSCHVLIDPALRDAQELWEAMAPDLAERRTPIAVHESLFPADERPCFYALDCTSSADRQVLESSITLSLEDWSPEAAALGQGHRICAWLWAPQDMDANDLARHLARQAVQYDLSRNGRILLRYFDPRILDLLWPALTDKQQATVLGPIHAWHFIDRKTSLQTLIARSQSDSLPQQKLTLNEAQWAAIGRMGWINQAWVRLQVAHQQPLHSTAPQDAANALLRAQMLGVQQEHDLIEFAYLAMSVHPRFDSHPNMRPVFDAVRDGEDFIAALQRLSPQQRHQIAAGQRPEQQMEAEKQ